MPSGSSSIREDLACPAARTCYTVGDHGTITRTANGTAFAASTFCTVMSPSTTWIAVMARQCHLRAGARK